MKSPDNRSLLVGLLVVSFFSAGTFGCRETISLVQQPISPVVNCQGSDFSDGLCGYDYASNADSVLATHGWTKAFDDGFDVNPADPDNDNWTTWIGGGFNNELQLYTARPENLTIAQDPTKPGNSVLLIKSVKEKVTGPRYRQDVDDTPTEFNFTSARIESTRWYTVGSDTTEVRIVSRIKLPGGYGMWPSFWSHGENWPSNGGIIPLQARGNKPYEFQIAYFYDTRTDQKPLPRGEGTINSAKDLTDRWHVYEVIWTNNTLTFFLDGKIVDTQTGDYIPKLSGKLHQITLNEAVGGDFFETDGAIPTPDQIVLRKNEGILKVDWVKVYIKK